MWKGALLQLSSTDKPKENLEVINNMINTDKGNPNKILVTNDAILENNAVIQKPNFLPFKLITFDANNDPIAVPTTIKAVGKVDKIAKLINLDPIIPLNKIFTTGEV